jgi:hypothetical protein
MATFKVTINANLVATQTFEVEADSHEDAVGDALELATATADGWEITRSFDNLSESDFDVTGITPDEPEPESDEDTEDVMPTEAEYLEAVATGQA